MAVTVGGINDKLQSLDLLGGHFSVSLVCYVHPLHFVGGGVGIAPGCHVNRLESPKWVFECLFSPINRIQKMYPPWMIVGSMVGSWLVFGIVERLINAIVSTLWYMACGFDDGEAKYSFGAMQLMTYSCSSFSRVLTSATNVVVQAVSGVASWLFLAATILLFTGIMYMAYEQYPVMARGFTTQWNSGIGNTLQELLVRPLQILNLVAGQVLPLWNTFAWITKRAVKEGIEVPIWENPTPLFSAFRESANFAKASAVSLYSFSAATFKVCGVDDNPRCVSDIGPRTLDLITPMGHVRKILALVLGWFANSVCGPLAVPLDIIFSPMMDINFAKAVHNFVNAGLWLFLQLPLVTEARCRLYGAQEGTVMCLPDFEPVFNMMVEGFRRLGAAIDNWMDVSLLVIQEVISPGSSPRCEDIPGNISRIDLTTVFGNNETVLVGMTESFFAHTDGYSVVYYNTAKNNFQGEIGLNVWPMPIQIHMGVAAVEYGYAGMQRDDQGGGKSTSMMGCRYVLGGFQICRPREGRKIRKLYIPRM